MLTALVSIFLTFLLTGLAGNRLVQAWQHRNWLAQQKLILAQKEHEALQSIFDEFASLASKRQHRMFRLMASLRKHDGDTTKKRLAEYDEALIAWNERLTPLMAKLTMHLGWELSRRVEQEIQPAFVSIGTKLEFEAKEKLAGRTIAAPKVATISDSLDHLQHQLFSLNRDILKFIKDKSALIYREKEFSRDTLDSIPTWELLKALFKPRVQRKNII